MKSLFGDNRVANLLMQLNKTPVITVSALASRLNVSERTIPQRHQTNQSGITGLCRDRRHGRKI